MKKKPRFTIGNAANVCQPFLLIPSEDLQPVLAGEYKYGVEFEEIVKFEEEIIVKLKRNGECDNEIELSRHTLSGLFDDVFGEVVHDRELTHSFSSVEKPLVFSARLNHAICGTEFATVWDAKEGGAFRGCFLGSGNGAVSSFGEPFAFPQSMYPGDLKTICFRRGGFVGLMNSGKLVESNGEQLKEILVAQGTKFVDLVSSGTTFFAISEKRELFAWGDGSMGQLGNGECRLVENPTFVNTFQTTRIAQVACSWHEAGGAFRYG